MDHPLILEGQFDLRQRVVQFLKSSYIVRKHSNIVFVCGGNDASHMRTQFRTYCEIELKDYDIFLPEYAMKNYFSGEAVEPFDIADFEELIGSLSEVIVIFPEAPGSFAETGYFAAVETLSRHSILALNQNFQGPDSFILLGPARKIGQNSVYHPVLQINYANPDFSDIADRIRRINPKKHRKLLEIKEFSALQPYEIFCLLHEIVDLMVIATFDDIKFILNSMFGTHFSRPRVKKILSILVGSEYLREIGEFGHFRKCNSKPNLLEIRHGNKNNLDAIRLEISDICFSYIPDFIGIMEEALDAD